MKPIMKNVVVFKVFHQVPHHYVFQRLTSDASKGYRAIVRKLILFTFLEDRGNASLPPIFRKYARVYY